MQRHLVPLGAGFSHPQWSCTGIMICVLMACVHGLCPHSALSYNQAITFALASDQTILPFLILRHSVFFRVFCETHIFSLRVDNKLSQ